jgi:hypothetical protein
LSSARLIPTKTQTKPDRRSIAPAAAAAAVDDGNNNSRSNRKRSVHSGYRRVVVARREEKKMEEDSVAVSPMTQKLRRSLPSHIYAVAARKAKNRFFIPSKMNEFAGIPYDFVMVDSGCNSFLLPFKTQVLTMFQEPRFLWSIQIQTSTGAIKSPTLTIKRNDGVSLGSLSLAGSASLLDLTWVRFHLGSEAVRALLGSNNGKLADGSVQALREFQASMGQNIFPERKHALLGQTYMQ